MKKIAIVVALPSEFELTHNILENTRECGLYTRGEVNGQEILLMQSGIGKVNAASRLTALIETEHPDCVINSGVAGGIGEGMHQGDIVIGTECAYHDVWCGCGEWGQVQGFPRRFAADAELLKAAEGVTDPRSVIIRGLICTGDQFIQDLATLQGIKKSYPDGMACDMESTAFAQVCYIYNVPFMAIRIVSDTPGMEENNLNQYNDFFAEAPKQTFSVLRTIISNIK